MTCIPARLLTCKKAYKEDTQDLPRKETLSSHLLDHGAMTKRREQYGRTQANGAALPGQKWVRDQVEETRG